MAKPREILQTLLEGLLGSHNVYYQPPESVKLSYPCIVYERSGIRTDSANNKTYRKYNRYTVTHIDEDPDSEIPNKLLELEYCGFDTHFTENNLNHDVFTLFF